MRHSKSRDLLRVVAELDGWTVRETPKGWQVLPPHGAPIVVHATESDGRAWRNTRARLRRAGARI